MMARIEEMINMRDSTHFVLLSKYFEGAFEYHHSMNVFHKKKSQMEVIMLFDGVFAIDT